MADIFVAPRKNKDIPVHIPEDPHMSILSSFCQNPEGVSFQTQRPEEKIILFLRSHFITNIPWIIASVVLLFLPLISHLILNSFNFNFFTSAQVIRFTIVFILLYYLMIFSYIYLSFLGWFYNVFIITTERLLDIDYSDIVVHNMAETKLSHIEDVKYAQSGFIPSLFNYGHLFAQTAGSEKNFEALAIPFPREATNVITQLTGKK